MSTTSKLKIAFLGLAASLAFGGSGLAQSSTTPTIGYYKVDAPAGYSAWTCGFVTKKDFQGQMTSSAPGAAIGGEPTTVITQTGATFGAFPSHYVEILSGADEGKILDIVDPAPAPDQIRVKGTFAGNPTYCVRKHATVGSVFANGAGLNANDEVTLYSGSSVSLFWDGTDWYNNDDPFTPVNDSQIIYPGQGFLINARAGAVTLTFGGGEVSYVKTTKTVIPVYQGGPNLVGLVNPLLDQALTLADWEFENSTLLDEADKIIPIQSSAAGLTTPYSLFRVGPDLYDESDPFTPVLATSPLSSSGAVLILAAPATVSETGPRQYVAPVTHPNN